MGANIKCAEAHETLSKKNLRDQGSSGHLKFYSRSQVKHCGCVVLLSLGISGINQNVDHSAKSNTGVAWFCSN